MTLFKMIIKLIKHFNLMKAEDRLALYAEVEAYEESVKSDKADKIQVLYGKIHEPIYMKLGLPFLYFWLIKFCKELMSTDEDDDKFLED